MTGARSASKPSTMRGCAGNRLRYPFEAGQTIHFNSDDLEDGQCGEGLRWCRIWPGRLAVRVFDRPGYRGAVLYSHHRWLFDGDARCGTDWRRTAHRVVTFNPASNVNQVSRLRLVNPGDQFRRG